MYSSPRSNPPPNADFAAGHLPSLEAFQEAGAAEGFARYVVAVGFVAREKLAVMLIRCYCEDSLVDGNTLKTWKRSPMRIRLSLSALSVETAATAVSMRRRWTPGP